MLCKEYALISKRVEHLGQELNFAVRVQIEYQKFHRNDFVLVKVDNSVPAKNVIQC